MLIKLLENYLAHSKDSMLATAIIVAIIFDTGKHRML